MEQDDLILTSMREFLSQCPHLPQIPGGAAVNWKDDKPKANGIFPAGEDDSTEYMDGNTLSSYSVYLQMTDYALSDAQRVESSGTMERLRRWVKGFDRMGIPLPAGCRFDSITAVGGTMTDFSPDRQRGTYRILVSLEYERMASEPCYF